MTTPRNTIRLRSFGGALVIKRNGHAVAEIRTVPDRWLVSPIHTENDHLEGRYKWLTAAVSAVRLSGIQVRS